jgi:hypothetical protein
MVISTFEFHNTSLDLQSCMRARHFSFSPLKKHRNASPPSQLKDTTHWNPFAVGSTRAKFTRGNMVSTLRGKATNIASRSSHAQSIPGLTRTDEVADSNGCLEASYMITENLRVLPQFLLFIDSTL